MSRIYAGRLGLAAWRRKTSITVAALLLVLIIVGVHHRTTTVAPTEPPPAPPEDTSKRKSAEPDSNRVQFVYGTEPPRERATERRVEVDAEESLRLMGVPYVNLDAANPYVPSKRIVHLDLKGAPPKVSYLKRIFPILKRLGATGLLFEYEDAFPFWGALSDIAAENAYTKDQILEILGAAEDNGLEAIPLVQTFGHMEFALKREAFAHLREVPESPQALCPSLNRSLEFVEAMVDQVLELHSRAKFIHIGCDEVFQMGACSRCRHLPRDTLFVNHVKTVAASIARRWPLVRPLIWDDMLRHVPQRDLVDSQIGRHVDPMVWVYAEDIYRFVPTHVWDKYSAAFDTAWSASAFKGAFGETEYVPNAKRHLENNLRWIETMAEEESKFKNGFAGIVLTGWQRYDHFAVLCELMPASIPSLSICLMAVSRGYFNAAGAESVGAALGCPAPPAQRPPQSLISLNTDPRMWDKFGRCFFPGNSFFKLTYRLHVAEAEVREFLEQTTRQKGWMTPYNIKHNYSAPLRIAELTGDLPRLQRSLSSLARAAVDALNDFADIYTISEWIEQRIYPDIIALERIQSDSQALLSKKTWEKRPLPPLEDLKRFGVSIPEKQKH